MKKGTGKTALLSMILIPAEIISILIGSYRVVGNIFSDWKADKIRDKQIEEGQFEEVEHSTYTGIIVPDLTGKDFDEAFKEFEKLGGWLRKEGYDYSDEYPENAIVSQGVEAGKEILYGSTLYVTVSLGTEIKYTQEGNTEIKENGKTESITVPDLTGLSLGEAGNLLLDMGLDMGLPEYDVSDVYPKDVVIGQSKEAGSQVSKGEIIVVTLNRGATQSNDAFNSNERNDYYVDDDQLCQLASDYYYAHNGVRPPCVRIDGYDGDIVMIHLYEAMSDHDATWDWYYVDRNTGETTNFMGESFNIFTE